MKSMTGYSQAQVANERSEVRIEIKSVNNRFLDLQFRLPKELNASEVELRQLAKAKLGRGRIEFFVTVQPLGQTGKKVVIDWQLADQLVAQLTAGAQKHYGARIDPQEVLLKVIADPAYVTIEEENETASLNELALEAAEIALNQLIKSREQEGAGIKKVLLAQQAELTQILTELNRFVAVYEAEFKTRYEAKLQTYLSATVDQERLLTELAILLERGDIHEELDRLAIHLKKLAQLLEQTGPVGRELDFLLQEMNREVNTIGSKSSAIEIKNSVVAAKTNLEKIREQIQNVE
ncbi:YicC/YloC family endoribonuclease [Enterococcus sp. CSURQ0835]|uniref:YicC/YloC family endoribonuclease n=1 Tax=Enterococcus sp. CSURQ0835 TaxID=2681394 RepID=UPI0013570151|nr:YicC/YloC family endoribonuclease [Enterococcus sp. CSURQ0835]